MSIQVGSFVRIKLSKQSRKALVLTVDDTSIDVEFDDQTEKDDIKLSQVVPLLPFELEETKRWDIETWLKHAKELEKLLDFEQAISYYEQAINQLVCKISVGATVIQLVSNDSYYLNGGFNMIIGTVSDMEENIVDLILEDDSELDGVAIEHIIPIGQSTEANQSLLKVYFNLAMCCVKATNYVKAVQYLSLAIKLYNYCEIDNVKLSFGLYNLRSRAHLLQNHFKAAAADIKSAILIDPSNKKAREMVRVIQQRKAVDLKKNKRLARHISAWVSTAANNSTE